LNEDEDLTHYGQSLSEIEKFENPGDSDSDNDEEQGRLGGIYFSIIYKKIVICIHQAVLFCSCCTWTL